LQLSTPELALSSTQKMFYALDLKQEHFHPSLNDSVNLVHLSTRQLPSDNSLRMMLSTYDLNAKMIRDTMEDKGKKIVTFSHILKYNKFPLNQIIKDILSLGQLAMNKPIEIEFAVNLNKNENGNYTFSLLQIRPIVESSDNLIVEVKKEQIKQEDTIIFSNSSLGNGLYSGIQDIVYVRPEVFNAANNRKLPPIIEKLNSQFVTENKHYILIGPGRWGSSDHWLGIPVIWPHISQSRIIVESGLSNYRIDPSQGTHFFQNLTSFHVGYLTVNPYIKQGFYNYGYLNSLPSTYEDEFIRVVHFDQELEIRLDGKHGKAVIYKPK
jgi:hypothetical protein